MKHAPGPDAPGWLRSLEDRAALVPVWLAGRARLAMQVMHATWAADLPPTRNSHVNVQSQLLQQQRPYDHVVSGRPPPAAPAHQPQVHATAARR